MSGVIFIPRWNGKEWISWRTKKGTPEQMDKWGRHPNLDYDNIFFNKEDCSEFCKSNNVYIMKYESTDLKK